MSAETEASQAAAAFRQQYGLGLGPVEDLVALIDRTQHVDVAIVAASADEHGMTVRDPERGVAMIAVARTRNPMRQRSTLAHELGHLVFNDSAQPESGGWADRDFEEVRADAFARHLLVPVDGLLAALEGREGLGDLALSDLSNLVQRFQVSPTIVAIQLHAAKLIGLALKVQWSAQTAPALAARFGWSDQYQSLQVESDTRRAPQRLLSRATAGYEAGNVSLPLIAGLRGISVDEVAREFTEQGIRPRIDDAKAVPAPLTARLPDDANPAIDFSDLDALEDEDSGE